MRRPAEARSRPTVRRLGCGTPARRGGGASPTTYRGMCRARGAGRRAKTRGCGTTRPKKGEGRAAELDQGGHARPRSGPQPGGTLLGAAACSGRDPDGVLVYAERVAGRARRPSQRASTVAPTEAAGLEGRDGAGGAGVGRSQRSEKGDCLCIKITLHPARRRRITNRPHGKAAGVGHVLAGAAIMPRTCRGEAQHKGRQASPARARRLPPSSGGGCPRAS